MIFTRALLTTIIGQCQVKALNTELAIPGLYKAVMRFMTSQNTPNLLLMRFIMTFMGPLKRVTAQVRLENGLGLKSTSATQAVPCRFRPSHGPLKFFKLVKSSTKHRCLIVYYASTMTFSNLSLINLL